LVRFRPMNFFNSVVLIPTLGSLVSFRLMNFPTALH
jgi:hypothetical protein